MNDYISKLKKLCDGATPRPWQQEPGYSYIWQCDVDGWKIKPIISMRQVHIETFSKPYDSDERDNNAQFVAESRSAIPKLIAALERCREQRDEIAKSYEETAKFYQAPSEIEQYDAELNAILKEGE